MHVTKKRMIARAGFIPVCDSVQVTRRKGGIMQTNLEFRDMAQLLAQADELIQQVESDILSDVQEAYHLEIEIRAQKLKKIKSEVQSKIEKGEAYELSHSAEGIHEALQDISRAMGQLKSYLAGNRPDKVK
jgi:negative regulator of genetic competence, sporulation and motility